MGFVNTRLELRGFVNTRFAGTKQNAHGKHERIMGQSMINSSQHTSTVTCTAALSVWHFSAFHSHLSYYCYAMGGKLIHILNFECEAHSHLSYYCYARL